MKIRLRFLLLLPMLAVLATSRVFWEFGFSSLADQEPEQIKLLNYALLAGSLAAVIWYWRYLEPLLRKWWLVLMAAIGGLMLESYADWSSWLVYPHVFNKLFVLLLIFGIYAFYKRFGMPSMEQFINVLVVVLFANLLILHRDSLSFSAFVENERGFNSSSAYLLVLVAVFGLNGYLLRSSTWSLLLFFICVPLIIFLQHRSVWIALFIALPIDLWLLWRSKSVRFSSSKISVLLAVPLIAGSLGITMIILDNPEVVRRFEQSIEDIANADKQGTGSWRLKQLESYVPWVQERPISGWRLEGFEVPMQFYDPSSDMPMWADHTGHHFHNFYLDRAFYFGILGILLVLAVPLVMVGRRIFSRRYLSPDAMALVAYFLSLVVFGTSYDWSTYHYGLIGLMLAALAEKAPVSSPTVILPYAQAVEPTHEIIAI